MTVTITAPDAESAREIINRLHPGATVRSINETGPATPADIASFREYAKAANAERANINQRRRNRYDLFL